MKKFLITISPLCVMLFVLIWISLGLKGTLIFLGVVLFIAALTFGFEDKVRWAELQNSKANIYFIKHGNIEDVPAAGWWY